MARVEVTGPGVAFWRALAGKGWDRWAYGFCFSVRDLWHWNLLPFVVLVAGIWLGWGWTALGVALLTAGRIEYDAAPGFHFDRFAAGIFLGPFEFDIHVEDRA